MKEINLKELYAKWPIIRRHLKSFGCIGSNAEDIFQEALLILCRKIKDPNFTLEVDTIHFVKGTCKFLWYNQSRKEQKQQTFHLEKDIEQIDEDWLEKENQITEIEQAILSIGKQCQEILKLFYGKSMSMELIAQKVGLRNEKVAKAQKYRCIQKVKDLIKKEKP